MTMTLDEPQAQSLQGLGQGDFDFQIDAVQKDGDSVRLQFENLDDAQAEFDRLADDDGVKRAELIDARSGNVLDAFEKEKGFPFLLVGGIIAAAAGVYWLLERRRDARGDSLSGLLESGGDCGCS